MYSEKVGISTLAYAEIAEVKTIFFFPTIIIYSLFSCKEVPKSIFENYSRDSSDEIY